MVVVSYSGKEINAKLVYYGAGLSGKTTNLEAIYEAVPDTSRGKMVSMKTQSDRTLFFDLLPLDLGEIMGFKTRFLLYTVPGQVFYNATRKLVLKGADAIVFVADSEVGKMEENKESLQNLRTNLAEYNINLDSIPWVIQYNKRDLPNVYTVEELNAELNPGGKAPFFEAVAREGKGVFETFRGISHLLMEKVTKDLRRSPMGAGSRNAPAESAPEPQAQAPAPKPVASAPPMAPSQTIAHEAHTTASFEDGKIDYGREIELPNAFPTAAAPAPPAPALKPVPPQEQPFETVASSIGAPQMSPPPSGATPLPMSRPLPPSSNLAPTPIAPTPVAKVEAAATVVIPAPNASGQPMPIVVPIQLHQKGTYEVVIRLMITNHE